ncbi:MAG: DNA gyrase subunit A [Anaerolineales bacterium]|nr:MAG: DNA gyrase subunit A [Anaerolineales bacterium]
MAKSSIQPVDIGAQMRSAYLDYAMSVIVSRALPDARDGLKPVHRRILYAMLDMGIRATGSFKKSARIVGEVLGKYHPHSDDAVYDAMARMAQDFSLRYMLVSGQGNFGSIGGDPPAAMRYTEARLHPMAEELLADIDKDTVDFTDNFDSSLKEPVVLPARLPNLLLNGSSGIAVGMATNIPPHNLGELVGALQYMIDRYDNLDDITTEDLRKFVKGPDFPTGAIIVGEEGIRDLYSKGKGQLIVRAKARIEEGRRGRMRIVVSAIPYQVNMTNLIERIAELVREGRLEGIADMRDESDREGLSIVLELKAGAQPKMVLNRLYKYTPLQSSFAAQILALVDGEPRLLSLKRALQIFLDHRQEVITRRSKYELEKAQARAHILEGLLTALANLDDIINTIRKSKDADVAKEKLMERFKLSDKQAQAILDMQLRRLAALERQKIEDEYKQIKERIAYLKDLLKSPKKILGLIKDDLGELATAYGDERRTAVDGEGKGDVSEESLVADEATLVSITSQGYVKRVAAKAFRAQGRGGSGVKGHATKNEDEVVLLVPARTLDTILFFSNRGKVYSEKAYRIPEADRTARGTPIVNILNVSQTETITAAVAVPNFQAVEFCIMATRDGKIKRMALSEFEAVRPSGLICINLEKDDQLGWAGLVGAKDHIILVSRNGQALRFAVDKVRPMGRQAGGLRAIKMKADDQLASMEVVEPNGDLLVISTYGYGKRTPLTQYPAKGRGTSGVLTTDIKAFKDIGPIAAARVVQKEDEVTIISSAGVVLRTAVNAIREASRATRGVRIMQVGKEDTIATLARIPVTNIAAVASEAAEAAAAAAPAASQQPEAPAKQPKAKSAPAKAAAKTKAKAKPAKKTAAKKSAAKNAAAKKKTKKK